MDEASRQVVRQARLFIKQNLDSAPESAALSLIHPITREGVVVYSDTIAAGELENLYHFFCFFMQGFTVAQRKKNRAVIFDVGANVGAYTDMAIQLFTNDFLEKIHIFEANYLSMSCPLISRFCGNDKVKINFAAVSDVLGAIELALPHSPIDNFGYDKMKDEGISWLENPRSIALITSGDKGRFKDGSIASLPKLEFTVNSTTLDVYCAENNIPYIDWLKLDIEGMELSAFEGVKSMLSLGAVTAGQFEVSQNVCAIIDLLNSVGYGVYLKFPEPQSVGLLTPDDAITSDEINELMKVDGFPEDLVFIRKSCVS